MRPTERSNEHSVRTGLACAIFGASPRPANRDRRALLEARNAPTRRGHPRRASKPQSMWETHTTRKPMLLLRLSGSLSLRYVARVLLIVVPGPATQHPPDLPGSPTSHAGEHSIGLPARYLQAINFVSKKLRRALRARQ